MPEAAILQRDKKSYAIVPHIPGGVISVEVLKKISEIAEKYKVKALKLTSATRIAIVGIKKEDIDPIWNELRELGIFPGAASGLCIRSIKMCPGTTFCQLGQQDSLALGMELDKKYHGYKLPNKFKIGVSGCINQCAENCIKDLGFYGLRSGWVITVGGNGGANPRFAKTLVKGLTNEEALCIADKIIKFYENSNTRKRLGTFIEEFGFEKFKKEILG